MARRLRGRVLLSRSSSVLLVLALATAAPAASDVRIAAPSERVGLGGVVRPGAWTPLRLTVEHRGRSPRRVRFAWRVRDASGDRVIARRRVTLSPQAELGVWLYAPIPYGLGESPGWTITASDAATGHRLGSTRAVPERVVARDATLVGLTARSELGLDAFQRPLSRHNPLVLVRGLGAADLPDRWYGYSALSMLIWGAEGPDPAGSALGGAKRRALERWVRGGGHLVVIPAAVGERWSGSPLASLLPPAERRVIPEATLPWWLGQPDVADGTAVPATVFEPEAGTTTLLRHPDHGPLVIAAPRGVGRVTAVGIELASPPVRGRGMPRGPELWGAVCGWPQPAYTDAYVASQRRERRLLPPEDREPVDLDGLWPQLTGVGGRVGAALFVAVVGLPLYWLIAAPGTFFALERGGAARKAWPAFGAAVGAATALAWGGAWLAAPSEPRERHLALLEIDAETGAVRADAWGSLHVPSHGRRAVRVVGRKGAASPTLASPGWPGSAVGDAGFLLKRRLPIDAARPDRVRWPWRATAKPLRLTSFGGGQVGPESWTLPWGALREVTRGDKVWPRGELRHGLPGPLHGVLAVYTPSSGEPRVWRPITGPWRPGEALAIEPPPSSVPLVRAPPEGYLSPGEDGRPWREEGYLGKLVELERGTRSGAVSRGRIVRRLQMLAFFQALPPPPMAAGGFWEDLPEPFTFRRRVGHELDGTGRTRLEGLMIVGVLEGARLPLRLRASGRAVRGEGWTLVRWRAPVTD